MSEDKHSVIRNLPFDVVARALDIDISRFKPRKNGSELAGPCPIHGPKRNGTAFSYSADAKWHCFSCEKKGRGAIDLVMQAKGVGFQEAVRFLEPLVTGNVIAAQAAKPQIKQLQVVPTENETFKGTYEKFKVESAWLQARGISREAQARFGVFEYRNDSRRSAYNGSVMIRISRYSDGECVGYLSRNLGEITAEKPKYRFPDGLHKALELFGAFQLKEDHKLPVRVLYLVESPFTVLKFWQLGLPAVSPFGWSLSDQQVAILAELAKGVICLPDRDKAEAFASFAHKLSQRLWVRCPAMPEGVEDPEQLSLDQIRALT